MHDYSLDNPPWWIRENDTAFIRTPEEKDLAAAYQAHIKEPPKKSFEFGPPLHKFGEEIWKSLVPDSRGFGGHTIDIHKNTSHGLHEQFTVGLGKKGVDDFTLKIRNVYPLSDVPKSYDPMTDERYREIRKERERTIKQDASLKEFKDNIERMASSIDRVEINASSDSKFANYPIEFTFQTLRERFLNNSYGSTFVESGLSKTSSDNTDRNSWHADRSPNFSSDQSNLIPSAEAAGWYKIW